MGTRPLPFEPEITEKTRRSLRFGGALLVALATRGPLSAQQPVNAPGGTLTGMVRDSTTGRAVGYALVLVVGGEQRVFASESGRFVVAGLSSGKLVLRIQQIGYRAVTIPLAIHAAAGAPGGTPGLEVLLVRQPVVLPEVVVHGDVCTGTEALAGTAEGGTVIDEAVKNAERILVLEKSYPFRAVFEQTSFQLDSTHRQAGSQVDTIRYDTRVLAGYRRGRVLEGRRGPREVANYFTTSDLAREEFQKWHCFWYAGSDTTSDGRPAHRINFAPVSGVRSADWAGSLLVDSAAMTLLRSEARLVNLRSRETAFRSASCTVMYQEIVPTLMVESLAGCLTSRGSARYPYTQTRWVLIRFGFIGKSPVPPAPP
jgi:hypothetical protein